MRKKLLFNAFAFPGMGVKLDWWAPLLRLGSILEESPI